MKKISPLRPKKSKMVARFAKKIFYIFKYLKIQLIELIDELTKSINDGVQTDVIVLDFAKAFYR